MYNFQKITLKTETFMEFYHPFFAKSQPELLDKVVRQTSKLFKTNQDLRNQTMHVHRRSDGDDDQDLLPYKRTKTADVSDAIVEEVDCQLS